LWWQELPRHSRDEESNKGQRGRNRNEPAFAQRQIAGMAKGGVGMRGRSLIGLLLAAFLVVALSIVWRRTIGIKQSEALAALDAKKAQLESERAQLEGEIRDASARQNLGTVVERRLGMHIPTDRQVVILSRSAEHDNP
jgi:cell division protein FtsL